MNCLEFRRAAGADPSHLDPEAQAHRDACPACAEYHRGLLEMDATIRRALLVPVPAPAPAAAAQWRPRSQLASRHRWYALAASLVAGVLVGSLLWVGGPRSALARELVAHVQHEPQSLASTHINPTEVDRVLREGGIRLRPGTGDITYATSCPFRGHIIPHLVVQTSQGPVTVLVLRDQPLRRTLPLREGGFEGSLVPAGPGSIAVIGNAGADLAEIKSRVLAAVEWLPS